MPMTIIIIIIIILIIVTVFVRLLHTSLSSETSHSYVMLEPHNVSMLRR